MTTKLTHGETVAALRSLLHKLDVSLASGRWTPEAVAVQELAGEIGAWMDRRPKSWVLPDEPTCNVRDAEGRLWGRTSDPDTPWQSGRICTTWPVLLTRGPLTEEKQ